VVAEEARACIINCVAFNSGQEGPASHFVPSQTSFVSWARQRFRGGPRCETAAFEERIFCEALDTSKPSGGKSGQDATLALGPRGRAFRGEKPARLASTLGSRPPPGEDPPPADEGRLTGTKSGCRSLGRELKSYAVDDARPRSATTADLCCAPAVSLDEAPRFHEERSFWRKLKAPRRGPETHPRAGLRPRGRRWARPPLAGFPRLALFVIAGILSRSRGPSLALLVEVRIFRGICGFATHQQQRARQSPRSTCASDSQANHQRMVFQAEVRLPFFAGRLPASTRIA